MSQHVNQTELAQILGITSRQVRNLEKKGIPHRSKGREKLYPVPGAVLWYIQQERERASSSAPLEEMKELKNRKLSAETRLAEFEAAEKEGKLIPLEIHEERFAAQLERLRARILNVPGAWAPALVGCRAIPDAMTRLKGLCSELLQELSDLSEETLSELEANDPAGG